MQFEAREISAVTILLPFDGGEVIEDEQTFASGRGDEVFGEEKIWQALARAFGAPDGQHLNRQEKDLAVPTELDEEAGDRTDTGHVFEEDHLVRVQVIEIERVTLRRFCVITNRATIGRKRAAVIRLGFRFRHELPPVIKLVILDGGFERSRREPKL